MREVRVLAWVVAGGVRRVREGCGVCGVPGGVACAGCPHARNTARGQIFARGDLYKGQ